MIGRITGNVLEKRPPLVVLDVQGVGYEIDVPMSTFYDLPAIGSRVTLYTHLVVREDAHLLFGFGSETERQAFRQLIKISGVGARTALSILSGLSVADLAFAVNQQDSARLIKVPGIGKKTAERLLLELKGKIDSANAVITSETNSTNSDAMNALIALGYNEREASWAIKQLPANSDITSSIKQALKLLAKQ